MDDTTEDRVLDGRVVLRQPVRGYRAGLDAALLAAACDAADGARVIEAGCGAGGALLAAATRRPPSPLHRRERDAAALALVRENIALNGLQGPCRGRGGRRRRALLQPRLEPFDAAMTNPPFFDDPDALRGPAAERRGAWMADDGLEAWIGFLTRRCARAARSP